MANFDLKNLTIKKFHDGLLKRDFLALEVTRAFFKEISEIVGFDQLTTSSGIAAYSSIDE